MLLHVIIGTKALVILVVHVVFLHCFEAGAELSLPSPCPTMPSPGLVAAQQSAQQGTGRCHRALASLPWKWAARPLNSHFVWFPMF